MHVNVTFRGMDHSPVVEKHIYKELEKLNRVLSTEPTPVYVEFIIDAERNHHHHFVEIRVKSPHYHIITHYETFDMYEAINKAIDRMHHELAKEIDKLADRRKKVDEY